MALARSPILQESCCRPLSGPCGHGAVCDKLGHEVAWEILQAVVKGIMHKNTAARRKSRMAVARRNVLISSGLYTPAPSQ